MKTVKQFLIQKFHELYVPNFFWFLIKLVTIISSVIISCIGIGFYLHTFVPSFVISYLGVKITTVGLGVYFLTGFVFMLWLIVIVLVSFLAFLIILSLHSLFLNMKDTINNINNFFSNNWKYAEILSGKKERYILYTKVPCYNNFVFMYIKRMTEYDMWLSSCDHEVLKSRYYTMITEQPFTKDSTIEKNLLCMLTKYEAEVYKKALYNDYIILQATKENLKKEGIYYEAYKN